MVSLLPFRLFLAASGLFSLGVYATWYSHLFTLNCAQKIVNRVSLAPRISMFKFSASTRLKRPVSVMHTPPNPLQNRPQFPTS